ncbi:MAG TPA: aminoglycoside phosphotransferase family protein [Caulobacteraceae bacterium]|jgi:hygromycin-B 7''-O-kinase
MPRLTEDDYRRRFRDPAFGADLAEVVRARHSLVGPLVRKVEGSSLVFRAGAGPWLKLTPPFFADSFDAEVAATAAAAGKLPARIPELIEAGWVEDWRYLVSAHVPGVQAGEVLGELDGAEREALASDLGAFMRAFHAVEAPGFERPFGPWPAYLARRLGDAAAIHAGRGTPAAWVGRIAAFLARHDPALSALGPPVLVHADLTAEHVMLERAGGRWRLSGVLDLADAMTAPAELDLIAPFVELFRGDAALQARLAAAAGVGRLGPELTMALAMQHRFFRFDDWFAGEIAAGCVTIEAVAAAAFPGG